MQRALLLREEEQRRFTFLEQQFLTVLGSCLTLCNSMDHSLPGSSVHGILRARILKWVAIPFSKGSLRPRDQTQVSCIASGFFPVWATGESEKWKWKSCLTLCNLTDCSPPGSSVYGDFPSKKTTVDCHFPHETSGRQLKSVNATWSYCMSSSSLHSHTTFLLSLSFSFSPPLSYIQWLPILIL